MYTLCKSYAELSLIIKFHFQLIALHDLIFLRYKLGHIPCHVDVPCAKPVPPFLGEIYEAIATYINSINEDYMA